MYTVVCVNHNLSSCLSVCISYWNTHTHTLSGLRVRVVVPSSHWGHMQQEVSLCLLDQCHGLFLHKCLALFFPCITFLWRAHNSVCACGLLLESLTCGFWCVWVSVFLFIQTCATNVTLRRWTLWSHRSKHKQGLLCFDGQPRESLLVNQMRDICCVVTVSARWDDEIVAAVYQIYSKLGAHVSS